MKNNRIAPSIMCIFFNICSFLILAFPAWYFSDTTISKVNNNEIIDQTKTFINIFGIAKLEKLIENYKLWGSFLEVKYIAIFNILIGLSLTLSLILIITLLLEVKKKSPQNGKLPKVAKIISTISLILTISALTIALIFSTNSKLVILDTETVNHTASFNLSAGIYLFVIFNIASAACGIISPEIKEQE